MAEVFGIVTGTVSIAAIFSTCVDCFGYVQLARGFQGDFQTCQLQLSCARLRLTRWGESVSIFDEPASSLNKPSLESQVTKDLLCHILVLFEGVMKASSRYSSAAKTRQLSANGTNHPQARVETKMKELALSRQKKPGLLRRTSWALYEANHMKSVIADITNLIDNLERIARHSQAEHFVNVQRDLLDFEVHHLGQERALRTIAHASRNIDPDLFNRTEQEISVQGHRYTQLSVGDTAVALFGDSTSASWTGSAARPYNAYDKVAVTGSAKVQCGNIYGGKGIFD